MSKIKQMAVLGANGQYGTPVDFGVDLVNVDISNDIAEAVNEATGTTPANAKEAVAAMADTLDSKFNAADIVELTQAEYDALPDSKLNDDKIYMVTDGEGGGASSDLEDRVSNLEQSFQDGCNTIVAGCTTYGETPASNSPDDIVSAIGTIHTERYNAGVTATKKGTAVAADVLTGKTFTNSQGVALSGSMVNKTGTAAVSATASLDSTNSRLKMTIPATGKYNTSNYLYSAYSTIRSLIGLTAEKIVKGNTILGLAGTGKSGAFMNGTITDSNSNRSNVLTVDLSSQIPAGTTKKYSRVLMLSGSDSSATDTTNQNLNVTHSISAEGILSITTSSLRVGVYEYMVYYE